MGISGLLPFLDKCTRRCHVSEFRGRTVAVDTYCWLHKGATACAEQLAKGQQTDVYVTYCIKYVKLLLSYDIHPILVFDGRNLPAKLETERKRRQSRSTAKQRAAELLSLGKTEEARAFLKKCIDVTPQMANALMRECRKLNVDCIVAPYESDAQLAFFNLRGIADFVISEDSDLVLFGCKKVLYKMDLAGSGQLVESDNLYLAMNVRFDQFTFDKFRYMCILSGCDYVDSLPGIGLKKALKFINLTAESNPDLFLEKVPRYLNMRHLSITPEYKEKFLLANATFLHQVVFDPFKKELVPLTDPDKHGTKPDHCKNAGELYDNEKALQVALGNLHPNNFEKLDDWDPPTNSAGFMMPSRSIWSPAFKKIPKQSKFQTDTTKSVEIKSFSHEKITILPQQNQEAEKLEYDRELTKQLLIYSEEKTVETEEIPENNIIKEEKNVTSPVLKKNPFVVKKRLSKFSSTVVESNTLVLSRFFATKSEDLSLNENKIDTEIADIVSRKDANVHTQDELSRKENILKCNEHIISIEQTVKPNLADDNMGKSVASEVRVKKRSIDDIDSISEAVKCPELSQPGGSSQKLFKQASIHEKKDQNESKRRKLLQCRTVGLSKQKSQVTLLQLFSKISKKS